MKKSYIERAMHMADILSSYMDSYTEIKSTYDKCRMASRDYNLRHKRSCVGFEFGSTRLAFIISDYVLKVDYKDHRAFGNSETELKAWDFIRDEGMEKYFAEITKYVSKNGITFYIMPRINNVGESKTSALFDYLRKNDDSAYYFVNKYFEDIHENNFGIKNGHPVIIDYAWNYLEQEFALS